MLTRILSAVVLAPPFVWCVVTGGTAFLVLAMALSLVALREYFDLLAVGGMPCQRILGYFWVGAIYLGLVLGGESGAMGATVVGAQLLLLKYLSNPSIDGAVSLNAHTSYGVLAYALPLAFLVLVRQSDPRGADFMVLLALVWMQDTAAYFWGRALGRHKLQPFLSPKKTWEGAILGLGTALGAAWALGVHGFGLTMGPARLAGLGLTAVAAQLGDLGESLLKRNMGAKDSGTLIPGHGGILDRFDSFTYAAPLMYYVLRTT